MAHAGNTKIWAKIISAYAKKCSITGFSSLRGGGGAKNASIYALSGHERIEKRSDQSVILMHLNTTLNTQG